MAIFSTLSQETRLRAYRLLVTAGASGMAAGTISTQLNTPHNTLSFHLNHLTNAGLISPRKQGRSVIYSANFEVMRELIEFMVKDCCSADFVNISEDEGNHCSVIKLSHLCCETTDQGVIAT